MILSSFLSVLSLTVFCIGCKVISTIDALVLACSCSLLPFLWFFWFFYCKSQPKSQPKELTLKKELINIEFLDLLSNHIQSASFFYSIARYIAHFLIWYIVRSIAHSITYSMTVLKIYDLYKVLEFGTKISKVKYKKSYNNIPSQDNLDKREAIYII